MPVPAPHPSGPRPRKAVLAAAASALLLPLLAGLTGSPTGAASTVPSDRDLAPSAAETTGTFVAPRRLVRTREVSFRVVNTNSTALPCTADGQEYTLTGRLVGLGRELRREELYRVLVHVHDLGTGRWFWDLRREPRTSHAVGMARRGHVSLVLDRLGYGSDGLDDGMGTCFGAQADIVHQVVQQLRSGDYRTAGRPSTPAGHAVLVGHGLGAAVAQLEAATFNDVAGLVQMSWSDTGAAPTRLEDVLAQGQACATGGDDGSRPGFAFHGGPDPQPYLDSLFASASQAVRDAAVARRNADPCGDALSIPGLVALNNVQAHLVNPPVLLLYGDQDARNAPGAQESHEASFTEAITVTRAVVEGAGNALPLEAQAPQLRDVLSRWICFDLACPPRP